MVAHRGLWYYVPDSADFAYQKYFNGMRSGYAPAGNSEESLSLARNQQIPVDLRRVSQLSPPPSLPIISPFASKFRLLVTPLLDIT